MDNQLTTTLWGLSVDWSHGTGSQEYQRITIDGQQIAHESGDIHFYSDGSPPDDLGWALRDENAAEIERLVRIEVRDELAALVESCADVVEDHDASATMAAALRLAAKALRRAPVTE